MNYTVGIVGFKQESNTLAPRFAEITEFHVSRSQRLIEAFADTNSEIAGFLDGCEHAGWSVDPLIAASSVSGGPLSEACFETLCTEILDAVRQSNCDALLLSLHGAMSSERYALADLEFVQRLRALKPRTLIVASHDFHANVSPSLLANLDGLIGFRTYPHVDQRATGRRAAEILRRIVTAGPASQWYVAVPMLLSPEATSTFDTPFSQLIEQMATELSEHNGSFASIFCVQPWLDFTPVNSSIALTTFDTDAEVIAKLRRLAQQYWDIRSACQVDWVPFARLSERMAESANYPLLLSEAYDSPTAGAAGDDPRLIGHFLSRADSLAAAFALVDPLFAAQAAVLGPGKWIEMDIGAYADRRYAKPLKIRAHVDAISSGSFQARAEAFHGAALRNGYDCVGVGRKTANCGSIPTRDDE